MKAKRRRPTMNKKSLLACALALASIGTAYAGGLPNFIVPVNMDAAGTGLNDTTAATPVGGNPGTTIGEQRRLAYQYAADLWNVVLDSANNTTVNVEASFSSTMTCSATSATLGSAGAKTIHADFANSVPSTWYGNALANARAGTDVSPAGNEIVSRFNARLGQADCLNGSGWYYGFDGITPAGKISFLDVVMHEIGHGLNFQGFYNTATGAPAGTAPNNFPDIYSRNVRDNNTGLAWTAMTDAQRVTAAIGDNLVWTGANVTMQAPTELGAQINLFLAGPRAKDYPMVPASYGPPPTPGNFTTTQVVRAFEPSGADSLGCAAFAAGAFTGKTVLIDRGTCSFKTKTLNAQNAGAAKVIIGNNVPSGFPGMGDDTTITTPITIPSVGVTQATAIELKKYALAGVQANLQTKPGQFAGTDPSGRVYLYAPSPLAPGSSFSHFDVRLTPNALMEPFINDSLNAAVELDLTPALFKDIGWTVSP
ncbi:MAG: PA domain-containing protein [Telluria sp.]